eukprot:scaffold8628_cov149-Amphora_coffeaeformis.AAC.7
MAKMFEMHETRAGLDHKGQSHKACTLLRSNSAHSKMGHKTNTNTYWSDLIPSAYPMLGQELSGGYPQSPL